MFLLVFLVFWLLVLDLALNFLNFLLRFIASCFFVFLRFFTAYNFCLLFHLVFCLLDFGFLLLMVCGCCVGVLLVTSWVLISYSLLIAF